MMLRGNLSIRPFYNERAVNLLLIGAVVAGLALTAFNASRILESLGERSRRAAAQAAAEADTTRIRAAAEREQQRVDPSALLVLGAATSEANALIDQRTFSWTVFFGLVEKTLPLDARLVAVSPRVERNVFRIDMIVSAKRPDDLSAFLDALQGTGSFYDVLATAQQQNEDGTYTATLSGSYLAPVATPMRADRTAGGSDQP